VKITYCSNCFLIKILTAKYFTLEATFIAKSNLHGGKQLYMYRNVFSPEFLKDTNWNEVQILIFPKVALLTEEISTISLSCT
jgi:hypothetical protein